MSLTHAICRKEVQLDVFTYNIIMRYKCIGGKWFAEKRKKDSLMKIAMNPKVKEKVEKIWDLESSSIPFSQHLCTISSTSWASPKHPGMVGGIRQWRVVPYCA